MTYFSKYQKKISALLIALSILSTIGLCEVLLVIFSPVAMVTSGYKLTENGRKYGWGFDPYQLVRVVNPDSGVSYQDRVNSQGWRDVEHNIINTNKSFRILVLGDSNTYGYIVPRDALYTRVLEKKLNELGYNVEIISMGYSGWGTDQQLEALKKEGLRYRPDLVIFQITSNDLDDNFFWRNKGKFGTRKPFYYKLNDRGEVVRHPNERFFSHLKKISRNYIISRSQILMRAELIKEKLRVSLCGSFAFGPAQVQQFYLETGESLPLDFITSSRKRGKCGFTLDQLDHLLDTSGLQSKRKLIVNIASWPRFDEIISKTRYQMEDLDYNNEKWDLLFALISQASALVQQSGGKLALISDQEEGHYNWLRYWHRISRDPMTKKRYYMHVDHLREFAQANNIGFVESRRKIQRALRDPHPDIIGNIAMAENILEFVLSNFSERLGQKIL